MTTTTAVEPRRLGGRAREALAAYGMLAPAFVIFGWFCFWPLWRLIHYALYQQNQTGSRERYVGPSQLTNTLTSGDFGHGVLHTFAPRAWAICIILVSTVVGIALDKAEAAGAMRLRNKERPMPLLVVVCPRLSV